VYAIGGLVAFSQAVRTISDVFPRGFTAAYRKLMPKCNLEIISSSEENVR